MITGVNFRPKFYAPAYNPVIWSVSSSKAALTTVVDFKYVFDVYIDGVKVNRFKQRPNPVGVGMIDVSLVAQSYLEIGRFANEVGAVTAKPMKTGTDAVCSVYMLIGEEYSTTTNPNIYIYPGTSDTPGAPSYRVGAQGFDTAGGSSVGNELVPVICLPYTLEWSEQQETLAVQNTLTPPDYYGLFGYVAPYVLKNPGLYPASTCNSLGLFLSKSPRTTDATGDWETSATAPSQNFTSYDLPYDRQTLTFLNRNPVYQYYTTAGSFPYLQASSPIVAWYKFYDSSNANIGNSFVANSQTEGGAPRATCSSQITTFDTTDSQELISLRVGPKDLEDIGQWTTLGQVPAYYTVQLFANATFDGSCEAIVGSPSVPLSELVTIQITEDCTSYLYPRVRLVWLNSLGGRDYWNFTMFAEETLDAKGKEYYQPEVLWSNTTPVITSGDKTQNWLHGGSKSYNKTSTTKWTIMTDWLTQDEVDFLKETVQSSQVWAYIGQQDFPYTGKIVETSYTVKTVKMVKMFKVTFNFETSTERSIQNV